MQEELFNKNRPTKCVGTKCRVNTENRKINTKKKKKKKLIDLKTKTKQKKKKTQKNKYKEKENLTFSE